MKKVAFSIFIAITFCFSFSIKDEKQILIKDIKKIDSLNISFSIENIGKYPIMVYSIKLNNNLGCERLLCSPKWHMKNTDGWGINTEWWSLQNYDSIIIQPKKNHCFFVQFNTRKLDTLLAVASFKTINKKSNQKQSLYVCLSSKNNLITEFRPDFETLQILSGMDPNKLYKQDQ